MAEETGSDSGQAPQGGEGAGAGDILNAPAGDAGGQINQEGQNATDQGGDTGDTGDSGIKMDAPPADGDWITQFHGEDLGFLQNRGLQGKSIEDALKNLVNGLQHAQKRLGTPADRLLQMPADPTSEGAMDEVWAALGRPEAPEGYEIEFEAEDSLDAQFVETATAAFHKAGLTKDQGEAVFEALDDFFGEQLDSSTTATAEQQRASIESLKAEWGNTYELNVRIAQEAVKASGANEVVLAAMEQAIGGDKANVHVIKFFNALGQKRGIETPFIDGDGALLGLGATTPEAARSKMKEMVADPKIAKFIRENNPENEHVKRYRALRDMAAAGM